MRRPMQPSTNHDLHARAGARRLALVAAAGLAAAGLTAGAGLAGTNPAPVGNGVVLIETSLGLEGASAAGTGMVLTPSGDVLTNNHVIKGATTIKVVLPASGKSFTGRVVGYDVADDVAVVHAVGAANLRPIATAPAKRLAVGDRVTAVGNANGVGHLVSAAGSISGLAKSILVNDEQGGASRLSGLIETDANVQPGDSGGPLFDATGHAIGMDTAGSTSYVATSTTGNDAYAIPIARALSIASQIRGGAGSTRVHVGATPFLGIQVQSADSAGAVIAGVVTGGPADQAGLVAGDVITALDGVQVTSAAPIQTAILAKKPGAQVVVSYTDATGAAQTVTVTLGSGPAQ